MDTVELVFTETCRIAGKLTDRQPAYAAQQARQIMAALLGLERITFDLGPHGTSLSMTVDQKK